jgi:predicted nucleic acid-binding protein
MGWCFEDEATPALDALLDQVVAESASVPALWRLEVANVLLVGERRGRLNQAQAARFAALLEQLPIIAETDGAAMAELLALGRAHELSAYDAEYLSLAARRGLPLATLDAQLRAACESAGVGLA